MKKEELLALGIAEDVAEKLLIMHGKDIEKFKTQVTDLTTERDAMKTQLTEAGTTIESFKKLDVEGIKAAADDWKAKYETATKEAEERVASLKFDHALDQTLIGLRAKNPKAVRALLDLKGLKLAEDGETVIGLNEQVEKIRTKDDYLFEAEKDNKTDNKQLRVVAGGQNKSVVTDAVVEAARKGARLPPSGE